MVKSKIDNVGGKIITRCRIPEIGYHALLIEIPVHATRKITQRLPSGILGLAAVMHVRPQSLTSAIGVMDADPTTPTPRPRPTGAPILALLDGVPISEHPLLAGRLTVEDRFDLERETIATRRSHGTAMASLIVHGDRNRSEQPLPKPVHVVPVMKWDGRNEALPDNRLIVDLIYQAVVGMRQGRDATAEHVLIVNVSLGNTRRPFHGQISAWARLLDRLAWEHGILFIVSTGNAAESFEVPSYQSMRAFEDAAPVQRASATLAAVANMMAERRIIAPAETVNGITVGARNEDAVSESDRGTAAIHLNPYPDLAMANPSSRLGPGFARAIKPEILMPGAREHLRLSDGEAGIRLRPAQPGRAFGLKVAGISERGEYLDRYTGASSAAAALASRTCHRIHDALEEVYGDRFTHLSHRRRATVLKALLVHPARWPQETTTLIRQTVGPPSGRQHVRQRENIFRFLGYGVLDADDAVACAADRATFWASGEMEPEQSVMVEVPVPVCLNGKAKPHALWATLAWFTPVAPGRSSYRTVRLKVLDSKEYTESLRVAAATDQPDTNQIHRGTVASRRWEGNSAPVVTKDEKVKLVVQREPDRGTPIDEPVPFGLAVTLAMPGEVELYDQVRQRLDVSQRLRAR